MDRKSALGPGNTVVLFLETGKFCQKPGGGVINYILYVSLFVEEACDMDLKMDINIMYVFNTCVVTRGGR